MIYLKPYSIYLTGIIDWKEGMPKLGFRGLEAPNLAFQGYLEGQGDSVSRVSIEYTV